MTENSPPNSSLHVPHIAIVLAPLADEDDDITTLAVVEEVTAEVWKQVSALPGYTTCLESEAGRGAGLILLASELAHAALAQKDLLIAFFRAAAAAVDVLAKQGRVAKIEVTLDGDRISVENADTLTAQALLSMFEARHPRAADSLDASSALQVQGHVSKRRRSSHL